MRRRSRAGGGSVKARRRKAQTPKRPIAPKAVRSKSSSASDPEKIIAQLTHERDEALEQLSEALEQQTATSEVLKVISSSPGDLQPVFSAMLESAARLCDASFGNIFRWDGEALRLVATYNTPVAFEEARTRLPLRADQENPIAEMLAAKSVLHVDDLSADERYTKRRDPNIIAAVELGGIRTFLAVPMLKHNELIGALIVYRQEVRPFSDKQIELVKNFAAQAVIAIENARLLSELRQSLEQQTATSDVLGVISSSPGELEPVFSTILENATRICEAKLGAMALYESGGCRIVALNNAPPAYADQIARNPFFHPHPEHPLGRISETKQTVHVSDAAAQSEHARGRLANLAGARTLLAVPMVKDNELLGAIAIYRQEVLPFTDKQIALVQNFAAQAVIAIENTRLLNELRETLERQTATADILRVIASTPEDSKRALDTIAETASRMFDAANVNFRRLEGDILRVVGSAGPSVARIRAALPDLPLEPTDPAVRALLDNKQIALEDRRVSLPNERGEITRALRDVPVRSQAFTPLSRESKAIGVMIVTRSELRPFQQSELYLMTGFADQAVIAIENARLFNELRDSLQQQTATADVLKVISRSTFDLQTVLNTLVKSATQLCEAELGTIWRPQGGKYRFAASFGHTPERAAFLAGQSIAAGRGTLVGRVLLEGRPIQVADILADREYDQAIPTSGGSRSLLGVPLLREGTPIGVLLLRRPTTRPFTDRQIELAVTFADQAVIAIENVRLFEQEQQRTRELAKSLDDLRAAQDRLVQTQKLASLGQLTAGIAHEIKNPLNFVNNFSGLSVELIDELEETLGRVKVDETTRGELTELAQTLRGNLDKIAQHGNRADSIVKNMLLHSREGSGEHRPVDINVIVEESLNLAYHGARAEKQGFTITLERSFDPSAGEVDVFPQEITRVLLNLIANAFYAATKRKAEVNGGDFEPTVTAATKDLGDRVEIRIRDNGIGIPAEVKDKMFNPFFTTKPAGEGTGLGLSISHDIIVKQHAGSIEFDTQPGEFTEFRIILPRAGAALIKS